MEVNFKMIGMARRAGKVLVGSSPAVAAIRSGKAAIVIIASDIGAAVKKKVTDKCKFYETECIESAHDSTEISASVGYPSPVTVITITDKNFIDIIKRP